MFKSSVLLRRLRQLGAAVSTRMEEAALRRRIAQEFGNLSGRDLDRLLADLGCTREDLAAIIRNAPRSKPLLDGMILKLGLEKRFAFAGPSLMRDIERRCATCPSQTICGRWLRKGGAPDEYRLFCPNAGNFDLLLRNAAA